MVLLRAPSDPPVTASMLGFYLSLLRVWKQVDLQPVSKFVDRRVVSHLPVVNSYFVDWKVSPLWEKHGVKVVGDFFHPEGRLRTLDELFSQMNLTVCGIRCLTLNFRCLQSGLLRLLQDADCDELGNRFFPWTHVFPEFSLRSCEHVLSRSSSRSLYKYQLQHELARFSLEHCSLLRKLQWNGYVVAWTSVYRWPNLKSDSDVVWRLLHDRVASPVFLNKIGVCRVPSCPYCGLLGTTVHIFLRCQALQEATALLGDGYVLSARDYILGVKGFGRLPAAVGLVNNLLVLARSTVYYCCVSACNGRGSSPFLPVFLLRLKSRLLLEFRYHEVSGTLDSFNSRWCLNSVLCSLSPDRQLLYFPVADP